MRRISERFLRHVARGEASLTLEQREWCLDELSKTKNYTREEHINDWDRTLADAALSARCASELDVTP